MASAGIELRGLTKAYRPEFRALDAVDLDVAEGELLVVAGPSGSGKTTLLRLIAGLDRPTAGSVRIGGRSMASVPPHRRQVALVFQSLALYSHLTVAGNLAFPLKHGNGGGGPESSVPRRIRETAELLRLGHLLDRYPAELSGGEQQRVALGRAIIRRPAALLLDEPLSSLDIKLRQMLRLELKAIQRQFGVPTIYVTHDPVDAKVLADRTVLLDAGKLAIGSLVSTDILPN